MDYRHKVFTLSTAQ